MKLRKNEYCPIQVQPTKCYANAGFGLCVVSGFAERNFRRFMLDESDGGD